ncbi:MAG TPA: CPXCG motif-containing cysteine-rich protein [Gemmatimonadaceae bacterium]|nr:CPXCG motif-containing cysteine-rich protein [Gemmatimonadaceae bacterium]
MRFAFDDDSQDSQDFDLDRDFPLGDGTADVSGSVVCPYCGETNEVALDPGSGESQEYVEDCQVCCQPWRVSVVYHDDGSASVTAEQLSS